jgi:hypothetical protein
MTNKSNFVKNVKALAIKLNTDYAKINSAKKKFIVGLDSIDF